MFLKVLTFPRASQIEISTQSERLHAKDKDRDGATVSSQLGAFMPSCCLRSKVINESDCAGVESSRHLKKTQPKSNFFCFLFYYFFIIILYCPIGKFGSLSPRKASCDRAALPNLNLSQWAIRVASP